MVGKGGSRRIARFRLGDMEFVVLSRRLVDLQRAYGLTPAEAAVSRLLVQGRTNAEIAAGRGTSVRTVANQVHSILEKVGVRNRRELVHVLAREDA